MLRFTLALCLIVAVPALAAEPPKNKAEKTADNDPEKVICKRFTETGSLVRSNRVCKTKREWDRDRLEAGAMTGGGACNRNSGLGC
jgi:hypothetical protein